MKLSQVIADVTIQGELSADVEISHLAYDSRRVKPGTLFFALRGVLVDGHDFVDDAIARGAVAVIVEQPLSLPEGIVQLVVEDSRYAMARAAASFYGYPSQQMLIVGVTGTNGKTTMTYLLESVLKQAGYTPAVVGTISNRLGAEAVEAEHTTPESLDLQRILADFKGRGADALVIEVSSHALMQSRVVGLTFDVAVFTNLTPEHLDYHKNMESYFAAKTRLFKEPKIYGDFTAVVNSDDPYGAKLVRELNDPLSVGMHRGADVRVCDVEQTMQGTVATLETPAGSMTVRSPLVGPFNLENLLCAVGAGLVLNLPVTTIEQGLAGANPVPGRLEPVENDLGALIVVDYAHTGDALAKALEAMEALKPQRIITVFGCGGDRDTLKRPAMGEVAGRHSDLSIVTSDNPRTENPAKIITDIEVGIQRICPRLEPAGRIETLDKGYIVIEDRHDAIVYAVNQLRQGDLLLIAGKGHEDYQVIGTQKIHFDDREQVRMALEQRARQESSHETDQ